MYIYFSIELRARIAFLRNKIERTSNRHYLKTLDDISKTSYSIQILGLYMVLIPIICQVIINETL